MKKQIKILKEKTKKATEHSGITKLKLTRDNVKRKLAENQTFVLRNKEEYEKGCLLIKKILEYKQKNRLIYLTGKQAEAIFKRFPELNTPNGVKSILVASLNSNLNTLKINSMVSEIFNKEIPERKRKEIIFTMIRSIKHENYKYLL